MNVHDGVFKPEGLVFLDEAQASKLDHVTLAENDVLLNITGASVARACLLPPQYAGGRVNQHVAIIRPLPDKLHSNYLAQCLTCPSVKHDLLRIAGAGATREAITKANIERFEIPLPPLDEQRRIAAILDQADVLRRKRRKAIERLASLRRSTFVDVFEGVEQRFPVERLENIVSDTKIGLVRSSEEFGEDFPVPYVRMDAITRDGDFDETKVLRTQASAQEQKEYALKKGDFLFNTRNSRDLVGKTTLFSGLNGSVFNNNIMRIRFRPTVLPEYVAAAFLRPTVVAEIASRKSGTTNVYAVYWRELKTLPLQIPSLDLQRTFAARVAEIDFLKADHRAHLAKLDALFSSLQHRAFRGEL
jgi:type I restriction enzyme S subunit